MSEGHVYTCIQGNNSDLISEVARLYIGDGDRVADVTFGKGVFWRKSDVGRMDFRSSDIVTCPEAPYDFRDLPYDNDEFDHVVLDPPYAHSPGKMIVEGSYQNSATTKGMYHKDIINLYREGMTEGHRILGPGGLLWVKCQDEIESSKQKVSHIEIHDIAIGELGMIVQDMFVLMQSGKPIVQHKTQRHARKNHSFLWIFRK